MFIEYENIANHLYTGYDDEDELGNRAEEVTLAKHSIEDGNFQYEA